jgi:hypothetical protein
MERDSRADRASEEGGKRRKRVGDVVKIITAATVGGAAQIMDEIRLELWCDLEIEVSDAADAARL